MDRAIRPGFEKGVRDVDPAITAFLEQHKAVGVPLYVMYPRAGGEGEVLPTVLTHDTVRQAFERAAR